MSEGRRSIIRIGSNYLRLGATFIMGLVLVPMLLLFGEEAYGLIMLLVSTTGVGLWLEDIIRQTMVRELGVVYHSGDRDAFRDVYCTALTMSAVLAVFFFLLMGGLAWLLPAVFVVPDGLVGAGRWFVVLYSLRMFFYIALAPIFNMYLVSERMPAFNFWMAAMRGSFPLAAWLMLLVGFDGQAEAVVGYAIGSAGLGILVLVIPVGWLMMHEPRLRLYPFRMTRAAARSLLTIGGWNGAANVAVATHLTVGAIIMNLVFGVIGNMLFGIAVQLSAYVRMATGGMTYGLDAVAARMSAGGNFAEIRRVLRQATLLHGWVAFPLAVLLVILAEPIVTLWVATRMQDASEHVPRIVALCRILVVGILGLALADGWIKVMYGAGQVRRYAPHLVATAFLLPLVAWLLLAIVPDVYRYQAVAWAYATLSAGVMLGVLPYLIGQWLSSTWVDVVRPFVRPLVATLSGLPVLVLGVVWISEWSIYALILVSAAFFAVYGIVSAFTVLSLQQRRQWVGRLRRWARSESSL